MNAGQNAGADEFAGKHVLVVGLGASGFAAARALVARDGKVRVTEGSASDAIKARSDQLQAEGVEIEIGGHDLERLDVDLAVVSPGIPPSAPVLRALAAANIPMISEVELASRLTDCDFLAVTGTNGKTTTTSLLAAMLESGGVASLAAGNIGLPLVDAVATVPRDGAIAVEVSSFQLAGIDRFRPKIAVVLNVAEDHTDWHGTNAAYAAAKARIVENQNADDVLVYNADDVSATAIAAEARSRGVPFSATGLPAGGAGRRDDSVWWKDTNVFSVDDVPVPGMAGLEDAIAAATAALEYGIDPSAVTAALGSYEPLEHRLQLIAERDGVAYVDDSKATNPHATLAAVRGLSDVVLIAGGRSKGMDLSALAATVPPVVAVIAIGEAAGEVDRVFHDLVPVEHASTMAEAVERARWHASPGGSVLLSPGCASLDMYDGYAARGKDFARAVNDQLREGADNGQP